MNVQGTGIAAGCPKSARHRGQPVFANVSSGEVPSQRRDMSSVPKAGDLTAQGNSLKDLKTSEPRNLDNGSKAIINNALAKPPSPDSTAAAGAVSATAFDRLRRAFFVLLVQPVVQRESSVAVSPDRFPLGTRCARHGMQEVIGSTPLSST